MARRLARSSLANVRLLQARGRGRGSRAAARRARSRPSGSTSRIPGRRSATAAGAWCSRPGRATSRAASCRAARCTSRPTTPTTPRRSTPCSPASRASRTRSRPRALRARGAGPHAHRLRARVARRRPTPTLLRLPAPPSAAHERTPARRSRTTRSRGCARRFAAARLAPFRAEQLAGWLYGRGVEDPERMTNLPAELRARLGRRRCSCARSSSSRWSAREDGTRKGVLRARDGARVEAVLIPEERAHDALRLDAGRLPARLLLLRDRRARLHAQPHGRRRSSTRSAACARRSARSGALTNVVFMGMGEPLLNLPAVLEAMRLLVDPEGASASRRGASPSRPPASCRRSRSWCAPRR